MGTNRGNPPSSAFRFSPRPNRANEIRWQLWEDEAFARARQEGKPVFLAISAIWCHWCHVMDETSYSDPGIIGRLNRDFVPVRVDTDQRPDVNRRYNQGGWPSYAILAPTGEVLVGGTYIAPSELENLLTQVQSYYTSHVGEIKQKIEEAQQQRTQVEARPAQAPQPLTERVVGDTLDLLKTAYDRTYGGFDRAPKFPHVDALDFLLENYCRTKERSWLDMVTNSLDHMIEGGLFDKVAGGFFRYSTTRDWSVPHYEKMLEDNAQLATLLLKASQFAGGEKYQRAARRTLDYLNTTLLDPNTGCLYGSQDAEEQYYLLPKEERDKRSEPLVDPVVYTEWNALAAMAYLSAYRVLGDEEHLRRSLHILDFLWSNCRHQTGGMYHYWDGRPNLLGFLPDQTRTATAMLGAYQATGKASFLQRARKLVELIRRDYLDEVGGGFFDIASRGIPESSLGRTGRLKLRDKSIMDNASAADLLLDLYALTGREAYRDEGEGALKAFIDDYQQYGLFSASYARAVDHYLHEPARITVVGQLQRAGAMKLLRESLKAYAPATVIEFLDTDRDAERIRDLGYDTGPIPAVYVCHKRTCLPPVQRPEDLGPVLDSLYSFGTAGT